MCQSQVLPTAAQPSEFLEDIFGLGLAFADLLFPRMSEAGTDFRRIIIDV